MRRVVHVVRLTVALRPCATKIQDLVDAFRFLLATTRLEPGCLGAWVWTDPDSVVHYLEEWATEGDMRHRVQSPRFTPVLGLLESSQEDPHLQFDFVTMTRGLDYVAEVRHDAAKLDP